MLYARTMRKPQNTKWQQMEESKADLSGDGEVDEVGGNADLRQVVWVGQLGGHV